MHTVFVIAFAGFPGWIVIGALAHHAATGFKHWDDEPTTNDEQ